MATIAFPQEQLTELKLLCPDLFELEEAGTKYLLLPKLKLPVGCDPVVADSLLCPSDRDGYPNRLFFAVKIETRAGLNWNANCIRIGDRNWYAFSWKTGPNLRLTQMIAAHLRALR